MKKTHTRSRLEVWAAHYINNPRKRSEADKKATIIQIEPGNTPENYIVEAMDPDPAPAEQHPQDMTTAYCMTCKHDDNDRQKSPCAYCRYNHDSRWEAKEGGSE